MEKQQKAIVLSKTAKAGAKETVKTRSKAGHKSVKTPDTKPLIFSIILNPKPKVPACNGKVPVVKTKPDLRARVLDLGLMV